MICHWRVGVLLSVLLLGVLFVTPAAAANSNKGLAISPLRQELTAKPGTVSSGYFTVSNLARQPITLDVSVKQFSVTVYVYDYTFRTPENSWVIPKAKSIALASGESQKVWFDVAPPPKTTPGGYYYALLASTTITDNGLPGTVQAASLLYVTVDGHLVKTSVLRNDSMPFVVFGSEIPYKFDVEDTGNVHFSAYFYSQAEGLFGKQPQVGTSHLLMPDAVRTISGAIPSPLLPGVYKVTYGYNVDFADIVTTKSAYVLYIPPWSIIGGVLLVISGKWVWQKWRRRTKTQKGS